MTSQLVVLGFDGEATAEGMLANFKDMQDRGILKLEDAVIDAVYALEVDKPGEAASILINAIDQLVLSTIPPLRQATTRAPGTTRGKLAAITSLTSPLEDSDDSCPADRAADARRRIRSGQRSQAD